jgi:glycosyltransferase involved in cell wall biosynthesis
LHPVPGMAPRYLTFNWHETYVHTLASIGGSWDIVPRAKGGRDDWWTEVRPLPANGRLVGVEDAIASARRGEYHAIVCHNLLDLELVAATGCRTITIFHTSRHLELACGLNPDAFTERGVPLLERSTLVFVSSMKQASWGLDGHVVPPGVDHELYDGWTGEETRVLHVGNLKRELAAVNGMAELEAAVAGLPFTLVGLNPTIAGARLSAGWDDLRSTMRRHRVYLHATRAPFEDGYNLAMLEAMATGMPVAALDHPTCPIEDGDSGRRGPTGQALRLPLLELLEDPAAGRRLGRRARQIVIERFPIARFRATWRSLLGHPA